MEIDQAQALPTDNLPNSSVEGKDTGENDRASHLQAALFYHSLGLCVIPMRNDAKRPRVKWKKYQNERPTERMLRRWWTRWPDANIAIICGKSSGNLCILDADPRNGGLQSLKDKHLPVTVTVRPGGKDRGWHYYYLSLATLRSCQPLPGLDFKAQGGYVVVPPSVHPETGRPYVFAEGLALGDTETALVPQWLLESAATLSALPDLPEINRPIAKQAIMALEQTPICIATLEGAQTVRQGQRQLGTLNLLNYYKSKGLPIEEAISRTQAYIHRLPQGVSESPLSEQLDHVVRAAKAVYGSPDPRYAFHCDYLLAMGMPCAGAGCPLFEQRFGKFKRHVWADDNVGSSLYKVMTLDAARIMIQRELQEIEPDGKVHVVIGGSTGVGKSRTGANEILRRRTIWLAQQHQQLDTPERVAQEQGLRVCRFPKLGAENCIKFDQVQPLLDNGINYQKIVCVGCPLFNRGCAYLSGFHGSEGAVSILATQHHHRFLAKFYDGHGNPSRPFLLFDENPLDSLRPRRELRSSQLRRYAALLRQVLMPVRAPAEIADLGLLPNSDPAAKANLDVHHSVVLWIEQQLEQAQTLVIPSDLVVGYRPDLADESLRLLYVTMRTDFEVTRQVRHVNLFEAVHELITGQAKCARTSPFQESEGGTLTFFVDRPAPLDKTVIILDATGTREVYEAMFGADRVVEHALPHVANDSQIIQVVNASRSRAYLNYDLGLKRLNGGGTPASAQTTRRLIDAIVARHRGARFGLITYEKHVDAVRALFPKDADVEAKHFSGQRGSNELEDRDVLIVLGTPRFPPEMIRHEAERIFGREVPFEEMTDVIVLLQGENRNAWVRTKGFHGPEMRVAYDATVGAELVQAVGRSRFLHGSKVVYVLSNQPLPLPGVTLIEARDLLGPGQARADSLATEVETRVRTLQTEGKTLNIAALAQDFGCSRQTVYRHLRTLGSQSAAPTQSQRLKRGVGPAPESSRVTPDVKRTSI